MGAHSLANTPHTRHQEACRLADQAASSSATAAKSVRTYTWHLIGFLSVVILKQPQTRAQSASILTGPQIMLYTSIRSTTGCSSAARANPSHQNLGVSKNQGELIWAPNNTSVLLQGHVPTTSPIYGSSHLRAHPLRSLPLQGRATNRRRGRQSCKTLGFRGSGRPIPQEFASNYERIPKMIRGTFLN